MNQRAKEREKKKTKKYTGQKERVKVVEREYV